MQPRFCVWKNLCDYLKSAVAKLNEEFSEFSVLQLNVSFEKRSPNYFNVTMYFILKMVYN